MAVDDQGNEVLKKSAEEVMPGKKDDYYLKFNLFDNENSAKPAIAPSGTIETGELIRLIGGNFEGAALPAPLWQTLDVNGGATTVTDGELLLQTNTTADGETRIQSVPRAEFVTATFNKAHLAFGFGDFTATDVVCEFGMFDPVAPTFSGDGVFFRNNSGTITIVRLSGGVEVETVAEADFNGNPVNRNQPNLLFIKDNDIHVFEIQYNAGRIDFFQDRRLVHRMRSLTSVAYETTHLTLGASIANINGNTANNTLRTRGFSCSRIGTASSQPDSITISAAGTGLLKNAPGVVDRVIINDTGTGTATLNIFDGVAAVGTPIISLDLSTELIELDYSYRMNNAIFFETTGAAFEVIIDWK